jgi:ParB family chromosome partitioning protein
MVKFMVERSSAHKEVEQLREKLRFFDGSTPARHVDSKDIVASDWANRREDSFRDAKFADFKSEIASAGGNVQPIKIRARGARDGQPAFEIVFGHRRHRACLELGLPVLAIVGSEMTDQQLYVEMERENRNREDLSAWEQGMMYARALDAGLFPSAKQLAAAIDVDLGQIGKAMALAKLPAEVIAAFSSTLDLQYRWATPLKDALQRDPEGVLERARRLAQLTVRPSPTSVLAELLGEEGRRDKAPPAKEWKGANGKAAVLMAPDRRGRDQITFTQPLTAAERAAVERFVEELLIAKARRS